MNKNNPHTWARIAVAEMLRRNFVALIGRIHREAMAARQMQDPIAAAELDLTAAELREAMPRVLR